MANNEQISQDVKVDEKVVVDAQSTTAAPEAKAESKEAKQNVEVKPSKVERNDKPKKKKSKDRNQSKIAKRLKETSSELKKVTWPKFTTVLKQTGVVLAVTAAFLLVVFGIDRLCSWLVGFIV